MLKWERFLNFCGFAFCCGFGVVFAIAAAGFFYHGFYGYGWRYTAISSALFALIYPLHLQKIRLWKR